MTVVMITHRNNPLKYCDRQLILDQGRVVALRAPNTDDLTS
jgi:ABC-type bacteriocin/lantibiotic exporter with double-glycine peptidase domain